MQSFTDLYQVGQDVEIVDIQGRWHSGTVTQVTEHMLAVRSGVRTRKTHRPSQVRLKGAHEPFELPLGTGDKPIAIDKFKVEIPAGTLAHALETASIPITKELNTAKLVVSRETWKKNMDQVSADFEQKQKAAHEAAGKPFKVNSPAECAKILFDEMGYEPLRRGTTGKPSVDKETLLHLEAEGCTLAAKIIDAREVLSHLSQLKKWEEFVKQGTITPTWDQYGTPMGRYTCTEPPLQNRVTEIRETIEAPEGYQLVSVDLSQAEYVTWASVSGDETLSKSFKDGKDFHQTMIEEVMAAAPKVDLREEDPRQAGKTINFALLYLMQTFVLARQLGLSVEETEELVEAYRKRAPQGMKFIDRYLAKAKGYGEAVTNFGRIRHMPELATAKGRALHEANKTAWHHMNCGSAAELMKLYTYWAWMEFWEAGLMQWQVQAVIQMHDEIIYMVKEDCIEKVKELLNKSFGRAVPGFLPVRIDMRVGKNWLEISK